MPRSCATRSTRSGCSVTFTWWLNLLAGAGLLLSRWIPQALDGAIASPGRPALFLSAFFVFLNLHHYLIDASIWRSRGPVISAMVSERRSPQEPDLPLASAVPVLP